MIEQIPWIFQSTPFYTHSHPFLHFYESNIENGPLKILNGEDFYDEPL